MSLELIKSYPREGEIGMIYMPIKKTPEKVIDDLLGFVEGDHYLYESTHAFIKIGVRVPWGGTDYVRGDAYRRLKKAEEEMRRGVVHFEFRPRIVTELYSADLSSKLKVNPEGETETMGGFAPQFNKPPTVVGFEIGNPIGSYDLRRDHPELEFVAFTWLDSGRDFYSSDQIELLLRLGQKPTTIYHLYLK